MNNVDLVVVGAGPAGISAAMEAAGMGASVLVLDEYSQPGGQYFRQPAPGLALAPNAYLLHDGEEGMQMVEVAKKAGVKFLSNTLVWGIFDDGTISTYSDGKCDVIKPSKLILACGAHERPVAFPGWTTPGVITAGAAQTLIKGQGVLPGHRILMVGTGPLQIAVAAQLVQAGGHLVGVLEGSKAGGLFGSGHRFWGQWGRLGEGIQYYRILRSAKVPLMFGRTVVRAYGEDSLTGVVTAEIDGNWHPVPGTESEIEVDTLCLGFGLVPSTKLARLAGCKIVYDPSRGGHVPVLDDTMQTSRPGVFVAGEGAGVAGAKAAELQGRIAGISAALQLGKGDPQAAKKRIEGARKGLKSEMQFAKSLNEMFTPKSGVLDLITDDTIICRCEEITAGQLRNNRPEWMSKMDVVRTVNRVGMGTCQGTICESLVAQLLAKETGGEIGDVGSYHIRPPMKPITVGALADMAEILPPPPKRIPH